MSETVIKVDNITKSFGPVKAVKNLSFEVKKAKCYGFLGPNGAGKTTMMKMIYAKTIRDENCTGSMDIFGYDIRKNELEIKYFTGVVPQENNLDEELNVEQNLLIYSKFYNIKKKIARPRIDSLLDFMELTDKARSPIKELSGGMKRRLVIARSLINNPKLLILDEPTTGLDPQVRHLIWDKLRQLLKDKVTILLTTHYMEEAFQICDEVLIMHKGEKLIEGKPRQLLKDNIEKYVLEVMDADSVRQLQNTTSEMRMDTSQSVGRIFSNDIEQLRSVANSLQGGYYHLREANLEDVFLKTTGRGLNEQQ